MNTKTTITISMVLTASLFKIIAIYSTNYDLFGDEAQYWAWSKALDFGYYSKPPLLAWIIAASTYLFGNSFEVLKLISFIFYFLTSFVVYLISLNLFKKKNLALLCALSFSLLPAVSISSFLLSTDVILIFFWSLSLLFLLKIRDETKLLNFLLLGIFLGLSFLAKYAAVYFFISLIILFFFDKKLKEIFFRKKLNTTIFLFSCFLVLLPNLIWNTRNGWITFAHTSDNASLKNININLFNGIEFILTQGLMVGPILFILFITTVTKMKNNFETNFLLSFSIPIFLIVSVESIIVRANANWAAVALIPFLILIFKHSYDFSKKTIMINNLLNFAICSILFFLISTTSSIKIFDRVNGISEFSNIFNEDEMLKKKYIVVQDRLLYSNLKYLFRGSQKVLLAPHNPIKEITNHFQMSEPLLKNFNKDFIYLGNPIEINYLIKKNKIRKIKNVSVLF